MCGISGVAAKRSSASAALADADTLSARCIRHRGPDGTGEYRDEGLWFGHQRLSIIDLSSCGDQPMIVGEGRYVICYNGEVYNFRELAAELALSDLRSHSDTEVVLRAFERLGTQSFARLNGMFAFAVYDRERARLWLVRDRLGIKPLYYSLDDERLAFGSEIKAVLAVTGQAPVCDVSSLHEWLYYGNALGSHTLYRGIQQLLPGHYLELDLRTFTRTIAPYWSLEQQSRRATRVVQPVGEVVNETRRLLENAVRRQLVSDVPVGVFLSGGIDSSAITAFASKHYEGKLATYSAGFDDLEGVDERPKARVVAQRFGTDHHEVQIGGADVADLVERMVRHHDQPFGDAANIPLYLMASRISGETKVVLQGDGGDELFGGYRRYVTLRRYRWLHAAGLLGRRVPLPLPSHALRHRVSRYLRAFGARDVGTTMARLLTLDEPEETPTAIFGPRLRDRVERVDPFARYREVQQRFAEHDVADQMALVDLMIELPDIFLEKVDRSTMAASLEVRVPFLDHELVDYVVRLPGDVKMRGGRKKWLLKQALRGIVPDETLDGPKTGFSVPFGYWLRTALEPFFLDHLETFSRSYPDVLNVGVIRQWYAELQRGRSEREYLLWKVLNFMVWSDQTRVAFE